ncbi:MAG: glycosyltransferase [Treponema sp.]|jgi:glycosyltransferase involved in cell wall biosynthesis|nr:glycosyltransferase [Treponema sp.]
MDVFEEKEEKHETAPAVSVIIPTYNRAAYLQPTLVCLLHQKLSQGVIYEIIIVDSGSDITGVLAANLQKAYPGVIKYKKIETSQNRSLLRNSGAELAEGEVLIFVDNDMMVPPEFIETHYNAHKETGNLVLLGKRLALMEFAIFQFGYNLLLNNFSMLENMPYYRDVRDEVLDDRGISIEDVACPWRFCWSHNFSIRRELFFAAGGFNVEFGENWGYEDIELGYQVYCRGGVFRMEKSLPVYHQQHFEQSKTEELTAKHNLKLFLRLHQYYDVELFLVFGNEFDRHIGAVRNVKDAFSSPLPTGIADKYDAVLGCLSGLNEKCHFGLYLPDREDESIENILILRTFYHLPKEVRFSLLSEALRTGKTIDMQKPDVEESEPVGELCGIIGYDVNVLDDGDYRRLVKTKRRKSGVFLGTIPDALSPRFRFLYLLFLYALRKRGAYVMFNDVKSTRHLRDEDFLLPEEARDALADGMTVNYGTCETRYFASETLIHLGYIKSAAKNNVIIRDQQYEFMGGETQSAINCWQNEQVPFGVLERLGIQHFAERIARLNPPEPEAGETLRYGVFMEEGYLEDGIDCVLEGFASAISHGLKARLVIKTPDAAALADKNFPLHNAASKFNKNYGVLLKSGSDRMRLEQKSRALGLEDKIEIIQKNMSVDEIVSLIASFDGFICATRGLLVPCEAYAAFLLNRIVFVPAQCVLDEYFADRAARISSTPQLFGKALAIPVYSNNAGFLAYVVDSGELGEKIRREKSAAGTDGGYDDYIKEITAKNEEAIKDFMFG